MDTMEDWKAYELQSVRHHQETYRQTTWRQEVIPEHVYFESGYIHNWNKHRLGRIVKRRKHWITQYRKNGKKTPSYSSKDPEMKRAGQWQSSMRQNYKKKILPSERIVALNATQGWKWEEENPFQDNLDNWITQYHRNGNKTPSQVAKDPEMKRAGQWQSHMRKGYKKKTLTSERIVALNATQGWKWDDDPFQDNLDNWITQYHRNGDKMPSQHSKDLEMKRAGKWQSRTHQHYKNTIENKEGTKLSEERIAALNATEGWKWSGR